MRKAFYYMFKDNKFWLKGLCYLCLIFIANFLLNYAQTLLPPCPKCAPPLSPMYWVCYIVGTLISLIPLGYVYTSVKAIIDQNDDNFVLPYMNPLKNFIKGFKYTVALMLLLLPLLVVTMILIFGIAGITLGSSVGVLISKFILIALIIFIALMIVGFNWLFADKESWFTFYKFGEVISLIKRNKLNYFKGVSLVALVFVLNMIAELFFGHTVAMFGLGTIAGLVITGILASVTGTYTVFVICYLTAKSLTVPAEIQAE